jgi:transposase-like protein
MSRVDTISLSRTLKPPTSRREFARRFASEADCEEFLFAVRYPTGFVCPRCGVARGWRLSGRHIIECANGHKVSLTAGTILHRSRQELMAWFHGAYLISTLTPGISAIQFQRQLGIGRYQTAFEMLHKIRSVLVAPGREPLHAEVEVDETLVGGKDPGRDGRGGDKVLVVGAVEVISTGAAKGGQPRRRAGRLRVQVVPNAAGVTLARFVQAEVEPGAIVHTDGWDGYRHLKGLGFDHRPEIQGKNRTAKAVLPLIHRVFSNLKAWLHGTHHGRVEPKYLQAYLNEYMFRFNRRHWRGSAFLRALMLMTQPISESNHNR